MKKRFPSLAHCLHAVGSMIIHQLHRRGKTADPQEQRRIPDRLQRSFRIPCPCAQEHRSDRTRKALEEDDAQEGYRKACKPCRIDRFLHPLVISRGIVERHNRQHPLADSDIDRVGNAFHFHDDSHCRKHKITVPCRKDVDADIGKIIQARKDRRGNADREHGFPVFLLRCHCLTHRERKRCTL